MNPTLGHLCLSTVASYVLSCVQDVSSYQYIALQKKSLPFWKWKLRLHRLERLEIPWPVPDSLRGPEWGTSYRFSVSLLPHVPQHPLQEAGGEPGMWSGMLGTRPDDGRVQAPVPVTDVPTTATCCFSRKSGQNISVPLTWTKEYVSFLSS